MMMTRTDICNRALSVLGHDRTIVDYSGDKSVEGERCRAFFDSALTSVLGAHAWDFCCVEQGYGNVTANVDGWARLSLPVDCQRLVGASDAHGHPYKIRRTRDAMYVRSYGDCICVRYVSKDVDTEDMPEAFIEAVVYQLAALLCGPMYGDAKKSEGYMRMAADKLSRAITIETDETAYKGEWRNPFIAARG